jgi:hypothetical protein
MYLTLGENIKPTIMFSGTAVYEEIVKVLFLHLIMKFITWSWAPVGHACNPSYLGG